MITVLGINKDSKGNIIGYKCSYDGKAHRVLTPQQLSKKIADGEVSNATLSINVSSANIKPSMSGFNIDDVNNLVQQKQAAYSTAEYTKCVNDYNFFVTFLKAVWSANDRLSNDLNVLKKLCSAKPFLDNYIQRYVDCPDRYYIKGIDDFYLCVLSFQCFMYKHKGLWMYIYPYSKLCICERSESSPCIEVPFNEIPSMDWFVENYKSKKFVSIIRSLEITHLLNGITMYEQALNNSIEQFKQLKF